MQGASLFCFVLFLLFFCVLRPVLEHVAVELAAPNPAIVVLRKNIAQLFHTCRPWQSAVTGFEESCGGNSSVALGRFEPKAGCYWMHEVHVGADLQMFLRLVAKLTSVFLFFWSGVTDN
jgi:hypothetical protein